MIKYVSCHSTRHRHTDGPASQGGLQGIESVVLVIMLVLALVRLLGRRSRNIRSIRRHVSLAGKSPCAYLSSMLAVFLPPLVKQEPIEPADSSAIPGDAPHPSSSWCGPLN